MEEELINTIWDTPAKEWWLTLSEISELLGASQAILNNQLKKLFKLGILNECDTHKYRHLENGNQVDIYNMEVVLALSFHVCSFTNCRFRKKLLEQLSKRTTPPSPQAEVFICIQGKYSC